MSSANALTQNLNVLNDHFGGDDFFLDDSRNTTPGTLQTLITYTVVAGKRLILRQFKIACRMTAEYKVYKDTTLIASGLLGAGLPTDEFRWDSPLELLAGQVLKLEFEASSTAPISTVRAHFQGALFDA